MYNRTLARRGARAPLTRTLLTTLVLVGLLFAAAPGVMRAAEAAPSSAAEPAAGPVTAALDYVVSQQTADGGFFRDGQSAAGSGGLADTLVALAAGPVERTTRDRALDRLAALATEEQSRPAYTGRIIQALVAQHQDPRTFAGRDHVADLDAAYHPGGYWEAQVYANALAALGHAATGRHLPFAAVMWFRANQCADGGFAWMTLCTGRSHVDTTALALNALVAGGVPVSDGMVQAARSFLVAARNAAGGFGEYPGDETNANSTGLALSAIAALGEQPTSLPWNSGGGRDPRTQLLALQHPDGGFLWKAGQASMIDNYATVQALPGVAGLAYPVPPAPAAPEPDPDPEPGPGDRCPADRPGRRVGQCGDHHPGGRPGD